MKSNIKLSLYLLSPVKLLMLQRNVIGKMTGNPHFATPAVPLATMEALADDLEGAIKDATNGSRQSRLKRDDLVREVGDALRKQADYVRTVCAGDRTMLESSGFDLRKEGERTGIPGITARIVARMTNRRQEVELRWKSVRGARGYQVWMSATDPSIEANWEAVGYTTRVSHLVTDLESFKAYFFCVSAIGVEGEGMQSDPALGRAA